MAGVQWNCQLARQRGRSRDVDIRYVARLYKSQKNMHDTAKIIIISMPLVQPLQSWVRQITIDRKAKMTTHTMCIPTPAQ